MGFYFFAWPDCLEGGEGQEPRIRLSPEAAKYSQFRHKGNPSHQQILILFYLKEDPFLKWRPVTRGHI